MSSRPAWATKRDKTSQHLLMHTAPLLSCSVGRGRLQGHVTIRDACWRVNEGPWADLLLGRGPIGI